MMVQPDIVGRLAQFTAPNVFNPWRDSDPIDRFDGSMNRRARLRCHFDIEPKLLLVGEAPGYQGCHFSGVPFTNEKLIIEGAIPRVYSAGRITTRERPWCEPSATIVWRTLHELDLADKVVLWNAFAWHPYKPGNPMSNRAPTRAELEQGKPALLAVLDHFNDIPVIPIGRVSEKIMKSLGVKAYQAIRHPSMGGATEFRAGMTEVSKIFI